MGEFEKRQRKSYIAQTNYKHFQGRCGILQLGDVYTCHGFLQKTRELEKVNSKTFFHKIIKWFIDKGFGNLWQLVIRIIHETPNTTVCNFRQANLGVTRI